MKEDKIKEIHAIFLIAISAIILLSLINYSQHLSGLQGGQYVIPTKTITGIVGGYIASGLYFIFGKSSFALALLILCWGLVSILKVKTQKLSFKVLNGLILTVSLGSLLSIFTVGNLENRFLAGGLFGFIGSDFLLKYFGKIGSVIIAATLILTSVLLSTDFLLLPFLVSLSKIIKIIAKETVTLGLMCFNTLKALITKQPVKLKKAEANKTQKAVKVFEPIEKEKTGPLFDGKLDQKEITKEHARPLIKIGKNKEDVQSKESQRPRKAYAPVVRGDFKLPTIDLLNAPPPLSDRQIKEDLQQNARVLEDTLSDFGIEAKVKEIEKGPVVTRYELMPAPGVKVQKIISLQEDIGRAMKTPSVRIVPSIPGRNTLGIEVANVESTFVYLKEVLESENFTGAESKLTLALGKDIAGVPVVTDLGEMPHLLIAGTTGSGKTVCVNTLITSLLFNATPDELKFILVDPKRVELAMFNNLPHLMCPVVSDPPKAAMALNWLVEEMDSRYKLLAKAAARNIDAYNTKCDEGKLSQEGEDAFQRLPYIVVVIDELADLMFVAQDEIEGAITRLAQLSRAVGIHMILATQRPSVDVITGVIKANFPARISFKVATKVDSRTVLDINGADKLLGKGDMLFLEPGNPKPIRAQGCFVSDGELEKVVNFINEQRKPDYNEDILNAKQGGAKGTLGRAFKRDAVYNQAVKLVVEGGMASVSVLQRRLGLGYTRAARIIDMMEQDGIVGPYQGSKPRDVLVTSMEALESKLEE